MEVWFALGLLALFALAMSWLARNPAERAIKRRSIDELARRDAEVQAQRDFSQAEIDERHAANVAKHNSIAEALEAELQRERELRERVMPSGLPVSATGNRKRVGRDVIR